MIKLSITLLIAAFVSFSSQASDLANILFPTNDDSINTDVVIIQKDGKILYERYARGYTKTSKHLSWSVAKTLSGILVAQAIDQGIIKLNEKLSTTFNDFSGEASVLNLLQMSSGIDFKEQYSGVPVDADVTKMLYLEGPQVGFGNFTLTRPLNHEKPGEHFYYSSGDTNILMELLKRKMKRKDYNTFPWKTLFSPLNITATFEQDKAGSFVGSSYIYMTARDYLKVGNLIVNKGQYKGLEIIPNWYLTLMKEVAPGVKKKALTGTSQTRAYSTQAITNQPIVERNLPPEYPHLPVDSIILLGYQGQFVIASPKEKLVVIRLATDKGSSFEISKFLATVKELILSQGYSYITAEETHKNLYDSNLKPITSPLQENQSSSFYNYLKVPRLIKTLAAKEFCSCLHVLKRSEKKCKEDLEVTLPVLPFLRLEDTKAKKIVKAGVIPGLEAKAIFVNEKLGCKLLE